MHSQVGWAIVAKSSYQTNDPVQQNFTGYINDSFKLREKVIIRVIRLDQSNVPAEEFNVVEAKQEDKIRRLTYLHLNDKCRVKLSWK